MAEIQTLLSCSETDSPQATVTINSLETTGIILTSFAIRAILASGGISQIASRAVQFVPILMIRELLSMNEDVKGDAGQCSAFYITVMGQEPIAGHGKVEVRVIDEGA